MAIVIVATVMVVAVVVAVVVTQFPKQRFIFLLRTFHHVLYFGHGQGVFEKYIQIVKHENDHKRCNQHLNDPKHAIKLCRHSFYRFETYALNYNVS